MAFLRLHHSAILFVVLASSLCFLNCDAFAAKKTKAKKPSAETRASSRKGFGTPAPSLADITSRLETRLPENPAEVPCPCGVSAETYADCCQPYHAGTKTAETPLRVLQSRYAAFYYRVIPYVMLTTHPTCQYWQKDAVKWAKQLDTDGSMDAFDFLGLTVGEETPGDKDQQAYVDFRIHVKSKTTGEETFLKEKSLFVKQGDRWFYASGEARPEPVLKSQQKANDASSE